MGEIVVSNNPITIDATVKHDHKFTVGTNGCRERRVICNLGVIHWTAGEGPAPRVFSTLFDRRLSIHFIIDNDGIIWQCADPGLHACAHAGPRANQRSVGIEVTNYGHGKPAINPLRERYNATIHGWKTTWADFLPAQYESLFELCDTLSDAFGIPRVVPGVFRRLTMPELNAFMGWCGHLHVDRLAKDHPKCDPGTAPFIRLIDRGYRIV